MLTDEQLSAWVESGRSIYGQVSGLDEALLADITAKADELMG